MEILSGSFLCPACKGRKYVHFLNCTDHFVSGEVFEVGRCTGCGLRFTVNPPPESEIGPYYQSDEYISHSDTSKGLINTAYHMIRKIMLAKKRNIVRQSTGSEGGRILDIGAGTGYFLATMKKAGWKAEGIEKSIEARSFAKAAFHLDLLSDSDLFSLPQHTYDVVTMWHVLEHIYDPVKMTGQVRSLLKDEGIFVVALPNPESRDAKYYGNFWAAYDVPRHLWHFGPKDIERMMLNEGFSLTKKYRLMFDSFYVSLLSEKYKRGKSSLIRGLAAGKISWINSLFNRDKSSSLVYIFKKN